MTALIPPGHEAMIPTSSMTAIAARSDGTVRGMSTPLLADAFGHHIWANNVLLATCEALTVEQLETNVPGTYGSIIETLRHTVGADVAYLFVLTDGKIAEIDEAIMDVPALRATNAIAGPAWQTFIASNPDAEATLTRHRGDGSSSSAPLSIRVAQVLHHGTDHRSQVCTALTSLGIEPPDIDVWDYARQDGRISETEATS